MGQSSAWQEISRKTVLNHPVLRVGVAHRRSPQGLEGDFVVLGAPDWVNVVPVTPEGRVVLIRQWRHGARQETLEIPGGMVDPGETPEQAAARELAEETGYAPAEMIYLGRVNPNPALFENTCLSYLARDARPNGPATPEPDENIEVVTVALDEVPDLVRQGRIDHSLVISALAFLWLRRGLA